MSAFLDLIGREYRCGIKTLIVSAFVALSTTLYPIELFFSLHFIWCALVMHYLGETIIMRDISNGFFNTIITIIPRKQVLYAKYLVYATPYISICTTVGKIGLLTGLLLSIMQITATIFPVNFWIGTALLIAIALKIPEYLLLAMTCTTIIMTITLLFFINQKLERIINR